MIRLEETIDSGLRRVQCSADSLQNEKLEPKWPLLNRLAKRDPKCLSNSQSDNYACRFDDIVELCFGSIRNVADEDSPRHHRRNDFREARVLANGIVPRE